MCCVVAIWWLFAVGLFDYIFIQGILPGNHYDETRTSMLPINGCDLRWNSMIGELRWNRCRGLSTVTDMFVDLDIMTVILWGYMELESVVPVQMCISTLLGHINDNRSYCNLRRTKSHNPLSTFGSPTTVGLIRINGPLGSISRRRRRRGSSS